MSALQDAHDKESSTRLDLRLVLGVTRRAPEILGLLLLSAAGAVWAVLAGPFPGTSAVARSPAAGTLAVTAAWLSIYFFCAPVLLGASPRRAARASLRRLAAGMLLVIAACAPLALADGLEIGRLGYLRPLWAVSAALLVVAALFAPEAGTLWRRAGAAPLTAGIRAVLLAMLVAGFAVAAVDALLHIDGYWEGKYQITRAAFAVNTLLLGSMYLVLLSLLGRMLPAILVASSLYFALGFGSLMKMRYMHAAVQPLDVLYVAEFVPQLDSTFGPATKGAMLAIAILGAAGLLVALRHGRDHAMAWRARAVIGGVALAVLTAAAASQRYTPMRHALHAAGIELAAWDSVRSARRNGVLFEFLALVPDAFVDAPERYSAPAVAEAVRRYLPSGAQSGRSGRSDAILIVYMIESLMDPRDLGVRLTADPIPTLRALAASHSSGFAVVPGRFGESASSEFEVLTGMSSSFLPERSVAYKQYVKRHLPALPCMLAERGFRTAAIQADPIDFYNRLEVYGHLCFQEVAWLDEDPFVPRAINGRAPADDAVVDAVIEAASGEGPAFVFAFPSSTHHPYETGLYDDSDLDLVEVQNAAARGELKYYVNTLRVADAAVRKLVEHFSRAERPVIVAIVGDHLPPLSSAALEGFYRQLGDSPTELDRILAERTVPLVVWSNLDDEREDLALSLNLLGPYLLERAGMRPTGFLAVVGEIGKRMSIISRGLVGRGSSRWSTQTMPPEHGELLNDYRLLQHDVLFGESHLLSTPMIATVLSDAG